MRKRSVGALKVKRVEERWRGEARIGDGEPISRLYSRRRWKKAVRGGGGVFKRMQPLVFLSWALQKWPAAWGGGVTRSLACDGWRREEGSTRTRYIIIHLLLSLSSKPPASEPLAHQDTSLLRPKAAWLIYRQACGKKKISKSYFRWPLSAKPRIKSLSLVHSL